MYLWQTGQLKRINLLEGSVSSGKTWISLVLWAFWVKTMPDAPDAFYLMSARSLTTLERNCLQPLMALIGETNFNYSLNAKKGELFGRKILLEGANDKQSEAKIRGLTLQGAYCDELTKMNVDFFKMLLSRLRRPGAILLATTNPDAPGHWLKKEYIDRKEELDMLVVKFLLDDNTTLPADYVSNIKKEYVGVFYQRFILGEWTLAEGLIYAMYRDAIAEVPDTKATAYRLSIDYGTMNAFSAGFWERHEGVWYRSHEYYYSGRRTGVTKTDEEYAQDLDEFINGIAAEKGIPLETFAANTKKLKTFVDPSAASFIALLQRKGIYSVIPAVNDVLDGIRDTATCMKTGKIKISPRCVNWAEEAQGYVWDDESADDRPRKVNDHAMDDMRYFVATMYLVQKDKDKKYVPLHRRG